MESGSRLEREQNNQTNELAKIVEKHEYMIVQKKPNMVFYGYRRCNATFFFSTNANLYKKQKNKQTNKQTGSG